MIMTNTKQCKSCVYGEFWARIGWVCKRAFDAQKDIVYQDRISNRTENKCFDYEKRGKRKMNAIIVDKDKKEEVKTVEKPVESVEKSDDKPKKRKWTDEDIQTLIHFYNKGTKVVVLADMFGATEIAIRNKLKKLKQSEQWGKYFTGYKEETTAEPETETLPEKKKVYKAGGIGFIEAGGGMMALDGKPLMMDISDFLEKSGMTNFYGKVEIKITPIQPTGIQVSVEEE